MGSISLRINLALEVSQVPFLEGKVEGKVLMAVGVVGAIAAVVQAEGLVALQDSS